MLAALVVAALFGAPAQAGPPPAPADAPPPLLDEPLPPDEAPLPPAADAPTDPDDDPARGGAQDGGAGRLRPDEPVIREPGGGLDPFATGLLQCLAGCGTTIALCGLLLPCSIIPYVGPVFAGVVHMVVGPPLVAFVETVVGDMLGRKRGALLWPLVVAYAANLFGGALVAASAVVGVFFAFSGAALFGPGVDPNAALPVVLVSLFGVPLVGGLTWGLLYAGGTALAYAWTAEDKLPGDDGRFLFPGFLEPAHPAGGRVLEVAAPPRPRPTAPPPRQRATTTAMAY